ncbi:pentapeptide repeat-containing protein [Spirillospora sp. CA-253888]
MGGIYALERLMADSAKDRRTIIEVLAAYIRSHAQDRPPAGPDSTRLAVDVESALTVIARVELPAGAKVDLRNIDLHNKNLSRTDLGRTDLTQANLRNTNLRTVNLAGANLRYADLTGADLRGAVGVDPDQIRRVAEVDAKTRF